MEAKRLDENQKHTIINGLQVAVDVFKKDAETSREVAKENEKKSPFFADEMERLATQFDRQVEETHKLIVAIEMGDIAIVPILGAEEE